MNTHIANELLEMAQYDLRVREKLLNVGTLSPGYNPEMEQVHKINAARLEEIIDAIGYPSRLKVRHEASEAAWLIVQHAISEPAFMKRCYALIKEAGDDVSPQNIAYLYDRICYFEGRPQRFGTQFDDRGMYPVEDKAAMVRLCEALQLKAHEKDLIVEYDAFSHQSDLHPDDKEFNNWRTKVGWI